MEDGFFLRKEPLSSMDSVNTRIENAVVVVPACLYGGAGAFTGCGKRHRIRLFGKAGLARAKARIFYGTTEVVPCYKAAF
jgi:hypothetical protein